MEYKKILIITYYWPPSGGAAVQRWLSFSNELAAQDYEVHVLTVSPKWATYQLYDESLVHQVDTRISVHTTKTIEPFGLYKTLFGKNSIPKPAFSNETKPSLIKKISRAIRGNFFLPDPRKGWKIYAVPKAVELIREHQISTVITAGPPHSTHFIGKALKQNTGVRWIADFHDLWTDVIYYNMLYHLPIVKKRDKALEKMILETADHVVTVGEKYKKKLLSKSERLPEKKISVLRIGYDDKLFSQYKPPQYSDEFIITYTGSIADFYQPEVFIRALKEATSRYPNIPIKLRFVGVLSAGIRKQIIDAGLKKSFEEIGYVPHEQAISYLQKSTVLLLVNPVTADEEMVIPGKIYEYLAAQKPIINITKQGAETALIIESCNAGKTFDRLEEVALTEHLSYLLENWTNKKFHPNEINKEAVRKFSRMQITKSLMQLLR